MIYQIRSYLNFLKRSTNQHGVHSPFVYDLVTRCFYDTTNYHEYTILKDFRKELLHSSKHIEVTDFGQGSRVFRSNKRKVAAIAKNAGISPKRQQLLFRLAKYLSTQKVLELGTSVGLATAAISLGNPSSKVITVEGCPNTAEVARHYFDLFQLDNIRQYITSFEKYFSENPSEDYDLVYIDGNHNKESTLQYFRSLLKNATNDSVFIFDDIYWSKKMTEAWQEIIRHPKVTVSIDSFYWGLVFFRKEQQKEHFTIRM